MNYIVLVNKYLFKVDNVERVSVQEDNDAIIMYNKLDEIVTVVNKMDVTFIKENNLSDDEYQRLMESYSSKTVDLDKFDDETTII